MDIYVKAGKKLDICRTSVYMRDFADIAADKSILEAVGGIRVLEINSKKDAQFLVSSVDVVRAVKNKFSDARVFCIGESDTLVSYSVKKQKSNPLFKWLKTAFVAAILLFGSATAIMSFFSDAEISRVLENFYYMVFGVKNERPLIIVIPYSVGIAAGITVFFNHFAGLSLTDDPTPIEVEMAMYEEDVAETTIKTLSEGSGAGDDGKSG